MQVKTKSMKEMEMPRQNENLIQDEDELTENELEGWNVLFGGHDCVLDVQREG